MAHRFYIVPTRRGLPPMWESIQLEPTELVKIDYGLGTLAIDSL